jgi:hypothetical protein
MAHKLSEWRGTFGRHETFPLRFGWLAKGFDVFLEGGKEAEPEEEAIASLGVGKNMVSSIRYWLQASRVAVQQGRGLVPTDLGKAIFGRNGFDPYLEDNSTIWLLHWLLASNRDDATTLFWFFNQFHKVEFSADLLLANLKVYLIENSSAKLSDATLEGDVSLLLRMYVGALSAKENANEDNLDSPLSILGLIGKTGESKQFYSARDPRTFLPPQIIGFALADIIQRTNRPTLDLQEISLGNSEQAGLATTFRLTEDALVAKLEQFLVWIPGHYEFRETAGIRQLYQLQPLNPLDVLARYYGTNSLRRAA